MTYSDFPKPEVGILDALAGKIAEFRRRGHEPICIAIGSHALPRMLACREAKTMFQPRPNGGWSFLNIPVHVAPAGAGASIFTDEASLERAIRASAD